MKRTFFFVLTFIFYCGSLLSQSCLPNEITFSTQTQIDSFPLNYPNCTEIEGDVTITSDVNSLNPITNLNALSALTTIGGSLWISDNSITSLSGLDNLLAVGLTLDIDNNDNLTDLSGLNNLTTVGLNFKIVGNADLTSLTGLGSLTGIDGDLIMLSNPTLADLSALNNLMTIGDELDIYNCGALTNLNGLNNLTTVGGNLEIRSNSGLTSISSFNNLTSIGQNLQIKSNYSLISLTAFSNLTFLGGRLEIQYNGDLTDLAGLDNIDYSNISYLTIQYNYDLAICNTNTICDYLDNNLPASINSNDPGCNSISEIEILCNNCPINITFSTQGQIDDFALDYPDCTEILGNICISEQSPGSITNLNGLSQITTVGGGLKISDNNTLTNLSGLNNITSIGDSLMITNNSNLTDLSGMENLNPSSISYLTIMNNTLLSACNIENICSYVTFADTGTLSLSGNSTACNTATEITASCLPLDGTLDTNFGNNGTLDIAGYDVNCILTQPDDKIVIFGSSVLRLNSDGTLDLGFGTNGVAPVDGLNGLLQSDGKIVVLGTQQLARLNTDGTLDATFGTGGTTSLLLPAKSIALTPDGKIITSNTSLVCYNTDGSVDTTFGNNGTVTITVQAYHYGLEPGYPNILRTYYPSCHVVVKPNGKIVVAGDFYYQSRYNPEFNIYYNQRQMRQGYNADGTPDSSFNSWIQGWVQGDVYNYVDDLILLPDQELLMIGNTEFEAEGILCFSRLDANGMAISQNCDYVSLCDDTYFYGATWTKAIPTDCGIFALGGYGTLFGSTCNFLTRTDFDGTPYGDFGNNGGTLLPISANFDNTTGVALQSDGSIILAGNSATGIVIARLYNDESCATITPPNNSCSQIIVTDSLSFIFDSDLFIEANGFSNNPSITFTDTSTTADAILSNISLEVYFRLNGSSCENDITIQLTDPTGNTQSLTAFTTCNGGNTLYYADIPVSNVATTGSITDWLIAFDDTNNQNSDYEYSVRFARLNYTALMTMSALPSISINDQPISNGLYQAADEVNSTGTVPNNGTVNFKAGQIILLDNGFSVAPNADFSAEIEDCN